MVVPYGEQAGDLLVWDEIEAAWRVGRESDEVVGAVTGLVKGDGDGGITAAEPDIDYAMTRYIRWAALNATDFDVDANWEGGRVPRKSEWAWLTSEFGVVPTPNFGSVGNLVMSGTVDLFATANGIGVLYDAAANYGHLNGLVALVGAESGNQGTIRGIAVVTDGVESGGTFRGLVVAMQDAEVASATVDGVSIRVEARSVGLNGFGIPDLAVVDADDPAVINAGVFMPDAGIGGGIVTNAAVFQAWLTALIQDVVAEP